MDRMGFNAYRAGLALAKYLLGFMGELASVSEIGEPGNTCVGIILRLAGLNGRISIKGFNGSLATVSKKGEPGMAPPDFIGELAGLAVAQAHRVSRRHWRPFVI